MIVFRCKGCFETFVKDRVLSSHLQHRKICKSIHYNLDFQIVINNWKQPKTVTNKAPKNNIKDNDNRQKTFETNFAKQYNSENENIIGETDIDVPELNSNTDKCGLSVCNSNNTNMDINDSSEPAEKITTLSSSVEHPINEFIYHNDERFENNFLKLIKEINAPNFFKNNKLGKSIL